MKNLAIGGEARAVARTVPGAVDGIPPERTAHLRADGGNRAEAAARVAIDSGGMAVDLDDLAFIRAFDALPQIARVAAYQIGGSKSTGRSTIG